MEPDFHSSHCDKCYNLLRCERTKVLRKGGPDCPVITCRFRCGHRFHECKKLEHELLCPKVRVPCINMEFGCPVILERERRGPHLETCPASVIVCTMEWNRWPLPPGKEQPFPMNPKQLDVAATLRDEKTLTDWKSSVPPTLRYLLKTHMNEKPVMPLGVSGHRIPQTILNQAIIEHNLKLETDDNSESTDPDESSDCPWGWKKCPPGLQESVCTKLKTLNVAHPEPSQQNGHDKVLEKNDANVTTNGDNNQCKIDDDGASKRDKKTVQLSLMVEVRTRCQRKPDQMYTFMCCREFRRDEFHTHFSHVHSKIHTQLNGWLFTRCPMAHLGCDFGVERMQPFDERYRMVYNSVADAFCFTQDEVVQGEKLRSNGVNHKTADSEYPVSLSSLPFELLVHLTKYLDPLSLNCLSMTNRAFRDACSCVVVDRGIVVFQWEKVKLEDVPWERWEVTEKKWIFTTSFSPIEKWKFGDVGRMITHLKTCPFFERNIPSKPFAYPVSLKQL